MDSEETRLYYILWIAIVLLAIIIFYFLRVMISSQAKTIRAVQRQLDIQVKQSDEDRQRIVGELHDDLGPYLSALAQKVELMQLKESNTVLLDDVANITDHIVGSTRNISRLLMPYNVKTSSLKNAVEDFLLRLKPDQLKVQLCCNEVPPLQQQYLLAICRLVQEIIHNTIKHSRAGSLKIDIGYQSNLLTIRTAEAGWVARVGKFSKQTNGIGRELMECRIRLLQGTMHVNIEQGKGTRYVITIPLPNKTHCNERN